MFNVTTLTHHRQVILKPIDRIALQKVILLLMRHLPLLQFHSGVVA